MRAVAAIRLVFPALVSMMAYGFAFSAPAGAASADAVTTFELDNGLKVVVIEDHRTPVVTHMVWYKVGASDEPPTKSGIAHFLEHLMFKGTEAHPAGEFSKVVADIGGQENAFTSSDYTAYFQKVAKDHLGLMMEYEADRMTGLVLAPEDVTSELQVVLEERSSRTDNDPSAQLGEELDATLYMSHPYSRPIIGWKHEVEALTRDDALNFYKRYYTPNNAILVVAGDVTPDEVRALAEETYGKVARRAEPGERLRPREPEPRAARTVSMSSPRVQQESVRIAWLAPSYRTAEPGEAEALDVLAGILGGGANSRLYKALVVNGGEAAAAGGFYQGSALDDSRFMVYGVPKPDVDLDTLAQAADGVIADLVAGGVTEAELSRVKNALIAESVYAQDSQSSLARIYGTALTTGGTVADIAAWPDKVRAVTADQVVDVARKYLTPERSVTAYLRAEPQEQASVPQGGATGAADPAGASAVQ
ncbi:M16 family metallopeptidase [Microbaculum sp. FT89]|uniref:M16 family metallopeptidase n=1 Tax=Microbaculum sp. FT89 TaxID=3447298 RepID=UPI003F530A69